MTFDFNTSVVTCTRIYCKCQPYCQELDNMGCICNKRSYKPISACKLFVNKVRKKCARVSIAKIKYFKFGSCYISDECLCLKVWKMNNRTRPNDKKNIALPYENCFLN